MEKLTLGEVCHYAKQRWGPAATILPLEVPDLEDRHKRMPGFFLSVAGEPYGWRKTLPELIQLIERGRYSHLAGEDSSAGVGYSQQLFTYCAEGTWTALQCKPLFAILVNKMMAI